MTVFFNTPLSCIGGKTRYQRWRKVQKIRGGGLCAGRGWGKGAEKWNKNRLMMELVSRWGSPLTSEAPHSLAYPSPVKRRGHTTDLSLPAKSSSGEPTPPPPRSHPFTLLFFLPGCGEAKFKLHSSDDWATPVTLPEEEHWQASSQVS